LVGLISLHNIFAFWDYKKCKTVLIGVNVRNYNNVKEYYRIFYGLDGQNGRGGQCVRCPFCPFCLYCPLGLWGIDFWGWGSEWNYNNYEREGYWWKI